MVNKRMMAVAAVLILAVPTLGAAATIYVPGPTPEQLVEGHTVFTVLQVYNASATNQSRFAAAVAVLVRENANNAFAVRFPGVLWFNDQYLVNPTNSNAASASYRYPCGGAVLAVNQGNPDPRLLLADINGQPLNPLFPVQGVAPYDAVTNVGYGLNHSTLGVEGTTVFTDATLGVLAGTDYKESYLITDPNDHAWIIDRYNGYTRYGTAGLGTGLYNFPVWAVNIMGHPGFIPDDGTLSCQPYTDAAPVNLPVFDSAITNATGITNPVYPANATNQVSCHFGTPTSLNMPAADQPCAGWNEPANAGGATYCYDGNAYQAGSSCSNKALYPTRIYNALLYLKLEDLTVAGGNIVHDGANTDTNGCQTNTEWACPAGGDNQEGNSHPFNPYGDSSIAPSSATWTTGPCNTGTNVVNHGGSENAAPGTAVNSAGSPYQASTDSPGYFADPGCSHTHATREIDLYFDATSRPLEPVLRNFDVLDLVGSAAPFAGTGDGSTPPLSHV